MLKIGTIIALAMVVLGAVAQRFSILPFSVSFYSFGLGLLLCALLAMVSGAMVFKRLARKQPAGGQVLLTIASVAPVIVVLAQVGVSGFSAPPIHDITTDIHDPPQFRFAQAHRKVSENTLDYGGKELSAKQVEGYPEIKTLYLPATEEQVWLAVIAEINALNWQILGEDKAQGHIEVASSTAILGFTDDIVIRLRPLNDGVLLDLRSISRVGVGDLGANAKRIRYFVGRLKTHF